MRKEKNILLTERNKEALEHIKNLLLQNPAEKYTIDKLASEAGLNRHKLTYGFKQMTGYSIHQFLIKTRMENAIELLIKAEKPIKEIAGLNGYHNTQNFFTAFKKYFGLTPVKFQKDKKRNNGD